VREDCNLHVTGREPHVVELVVSDTGHGVSREMKEGSSCRIFSTKQRGTGLGLAIGESDRGMTITARSEWKKTSRWAAVRGGLPVAADAVGTPAAS